MFEAVALTNQNLFEETHNIAGQNPIVDSIMVFGADYVIIIALLLAIFLFFTKGIIEKKAALLTLLSFGIGFILIKTVGKFIEEPRPFIKYDFQPLINFAPNDTFPSDHTIILTILFLSFYYYRSKYAMLFLVALIWTGFARVYAGVHYPGDIAGGLIFGLVSVFIAVKIKKYLVKKY